MRRSMLVLFVAATALSFAFGNASAAIINFDDVADGTVINSAYSALGVTFNNPVGVTSNADSPNIFARTAASPTQSFAPSSPNVVSVFGTGFPDFRSTFGAVDATFSSPQMIVSIDARPVGTFEGLGAINNRPFLEAYAGTTFLGNVLYTGALPAGVREVGPTETLTFTSPTANITSVRFSVQSGQGGQLISGLFDNLNFDTQGPPNPVPEPSALLLLGIGLTSVTGIAWRRHRQA